MVKGYSSESDESSEKWRWDGGACVALEEDSRKWRDGLTQLKARIGQSKTWTSGASGSVQGPGLFRSDDWDSQDWVRQFM